MRVLTSNLAIRFYESDGWTEEVLNTCVKTSNHLRPFRYFPDNIGESNIAYWVPEVGTRLDFDLLMPKITKVVRMYNDNPHLADRQHLERFNW